MKRTHTENIYLTLFQSKPCIGRNVGHFPRYSSCAWTVKTTQKRIPKIFIIVLFCLPLCDFFKLRSGKVVSVRMKICNWLIDRKTGTKLLKLWNVCVSVRTASIKLYDLFHVFVAWVCQIHRASKGVNLTTKKYTIRITKQLNAHNIYLITNNNLDSNYGLQLDTFLSLEQSRCNPCRQWLLHKSELLNA